MFFLSMCNVVGKWGSTDGVVFTQVLLPRENQDVIIPPHAFASHLQKQSATEEIC